MPAHMRGIIKTPWGDVHWTTWPTERDAVGCDGLYIERVVRVPWATTLRRLVRKAIGRA